MIYLTLQEQLTQINEAIAAIEIGGQEYQVGPTRLKRADLKTLYERQRELQTQIESQSTGTSLFSNTYAAIFDGR